MKAVLDLVRRIEAKPRSAREELRHFVEATSFPIVENDTATFFFWDDSPAEAVYLIHWVFGLESRQAFQRIRGTHAWFLALELPHSGRVEYKFEVHRGGGRALVRDPRNDQLARDPFGSNSVCTMPGYAIPPWTALETGVRPGRLESFEFHSGVFGGNRNVQVYLPCEYKPHKRYPLLICHDGSDYLRYAGMQPVLDNLIHRHEIRPMIVAFIDGHARNQEYGADPRQPKHVAEEVLPEMRARYGVSRDPDEIGVMGASFGGVASLFTAFSYPNVFGQVLLQSGSFLFTDVGHHDRGPLWDPVAAFVNQFRADPTRVKASRFYMSCGTFESLIYYNRSLVPLMRGAGLDVRFVEAQDGHNWIAWRDRLREGLTYLFPGHLWMYYD